MRTIDVAKINKAMRRAQKHYAEQTTDILVQLRDEGFDGHEAMSILGSGLSYIIAKQMETIVAQLPREGRKDYVATWLQTFIDAVISGMDFHATPAKFGIRPAKETKQ